eukprot:TRINITY_DN12775_c0_g1_i1.p1 TRINITY_DN12775_c0_g1~~TRINITY_DN12775_c0_g1_i1.p1  ORF type:complete len:373 (-),score=132.44 TRINITY_DN12775_c0_g1_i1:45-1163(-)
MALYSLGLRSLERFDLNLSHLRIQRTRLRTNRDVNQSFCVRRIQLDQSTQNNVRVKEKKLHPGEEIYLRTMEKQRIMKEKKHGDDSIDIKRREPPPLLIRQAARNLDHILVNELYQKHIYSLNFDEEKIDEFHEEISEVILNSFWKLSREVYLTWLERFSETAGGKRRVLRDSEWGSLMAFAVENKMKSLANKIWVHLKEKAWRRSEHEEQLIEKIAKHSIEEGAGNKARLAVASLLIPHKFWNSKGFKTDELEMFENIVRKMAADLSETQLKPDKWNTTESVGEKRFLDKEFLLDPKKRAMLQYNLMNSFESYSKEFDNVEDWKETKDLRRAMDLLIEVGESQNLPLREEGYMDIHFLLSKNIEFTKEFGI